MQVIWKDKAIQHLEQLTDYGFITFGARAVSRFVHNIQAYDKRLSSSPYMGALEPLLAHRRLPYRSLVVHSHYKLIYWVDEEQDTVFIAALWDTRRNPDNLSESL